MATTHHDSTAYSRSEFPQLEASNRGFDPTYSPKFCTSTDLSRQEVTILTNATDRQSPQQRDHFLVCSVCKHNRLVSRCFGNSFGIVCGDCLAASADIQD